MTEQKRARTAWYEPFFLCRYEAFDQPLAAAFAFRRRATSALAAAPNRITIGGAGTGAGGPPLEPLLDPLLLPELDPELELELELELLPLLDPLLLPELHPPFELKPPLELQPLLLEP